MTATPRQPASGERAEWLRALARLHERVIAFDGDGVVVFVEDGGTGATSGDTGAHAPLTARDWLARQPEAELREALAPWMPDRAGDATCVELRWHGSPHVARRLDVGGSTSDPLTVVLIDAIDAEPGADDEAETVDDLQRRNAELESSLRSAAHDLRSPLVSVLGFARLLRDEFGDPIGRTGRHFVDRIEQAGRNMERLLHDLLELARIEDAPTMPVHVNVVPLLEQLAGEMKMKLDEAGVTLVFPAEAPIVVCDRTRLYQLLSNLIGNALRHAANDDGGRIDVSVTDAGSGWTLRVQDDGPGIAPEDRERIFEAFQRAEVGPVRSGPKSTGLGLAIVRRIVEKQGGSVHVESEPGEGACFVVFLPKPDGPGDA